MFQFERFHIQHSIFHALILLIWVQPCESIGTIEEKFDNGSFQPPEHLAGKELLGEVVDEDLVLGACSFEKAILGRQADLEGVFIFIVFLLVLNNQAWGCGIYIKILFDVLRWI